MTRAQRRRGGFTLIEMVIAIALLAIVALMSWRSLTGIIRGQQGVIETMTDLREVDRMFDQMSIDLADAVPDNDLGDGAIAFDGSRLRIVRTVLAPGQPTRWQVVRYRSADGVLWRELSAPLATRAAALAAQTAPPAQRQALIGRAGAIRLRGWLNATGAGTMPGGTAEGWAQTDGGRKPPPLPPGTPPPLPQHAVGGIEVVVLAGSPPSAYRRVLTSGP
ncbi:MULTISPECIES: PulJ/GspJ family protein [Cupriavidus]